MKITEIEFGFTKNLGNYKSQRITYRATLELWENPEESLAVLRSKVAQELNLPDQWHDLKHKFARQLAALEAVELKLQTKKTELAKAEEAWENFAEFLVGHGVDPTTLTIEDFHNTRIEHSPASIEKTTEHVADDSCEEEEEDNDWLYGQEDDDYYGDD